MEILVNKSQPDKNMDKAITTIILSENHPF